jgi:hypothetical protein
MAGRGKAKASASAADPRHCGGSAQSARGAGTAATLSHLRNHAAEATLARRPKPRSHKRNCAVSEFTALDLLFAKGGGAAISDDSEPVSLWLGPRAMKHPAVMKP